MHSSLSTAAGLSSRACEEGDGLKSVAGSLCRRRNFSASVLNSSSRGLRTSDDAERLTRGSWRFFAGVGQVPSGKLWELEYLLGRNRATLGIMLDYKRWMLDVSSSAYSHYNIVIIQFHYLSKNEGEQAFIDIVMADELWQSSPSNIMSG